jgi:hypothetical protein
MPDSFTPSSWPTELLCKIILLRVREDLSDLSSSYCVFHPWWLNLRHVSRLFRDILMTYPIPYSSVCTMFRGDCDNDNDSFREASALFDRRICHIDALCRATPFRVALDVSFDACDNLSTTSVNAALNSLRSARALTLCIHSFHFSSASSFHHVVDLPPFPRLTHAYLSSGASKPLRRSYLDPGDSLLQKTLTRFVLRALICVR